MGMTLNPWTNIGNKFDAGKTNGLVGSINSVFLTMAWSGAVISIIAVAIMLMARSSKNRQKGKERFTNTLIIILCISGLTTIVGTIMTIVYSL